jgi:zinc transporter, ZIP family
LGEALLWGAISAGSLLIGAALALLRPFPPRVIGWIMAFGAGVLISAVAFELVEEGIEQAGRLREVALGLFAGSVTYFVGDALIDRRGGGDRKRSSGVQAGGSGLAIVLGTVLDGVPESVVIGLTLVKGGAVGVAMVVAVFLSNLPEAISATAGLRRAAWSTGRILALWGTVVAVSTAASAAGYGIFADASAGATAVVLGFAAGAILTMLADTMMPEAFEHGGRLVGLLTTVGFATAVAVDAFA